MACHDILASRNSAMQPAHGVGEGLGYGMAGGERHDYLTNIDDTNHIKINA